MKKITGLFLSVAMLFSLSACGGSKVSDDALNAFETAVINVTKMKSTNYSLGFKQMNGKEVSMNVKLSGTFTNKDAKPQLDASMDIETDGNSQEGMVKLYLTDNMMYINLMELAKQKQPVDLTSVTKMASPVIKKGTINDASFKKDLKEASIKGDKVTIIFDSAKIKSQLNKLSKKDTTGMLAAYKDMDIKELKMVADTKNKMINTVEITIDMNAKVDGKSTNSKVIINLAFKNINKAKDIVFPDFTEYVAADSEKSLLGL